MNSQNNIDSSSDGGKVIPKSILIVLLLILFGLAVWGTYFWQHNKLNSASQQVKDLSSKLTFANNQNQLQYTTYTSQGGVKINVYFPKHSSKVSNPIAVVGEVPGDWSFEAAFPVTLKDSKGNEIAQVSAQVLGDWTTNELVPFSAKLVYASTETGTGMIVLKKDNPSGLAKNDDTVYIPVTFQ